MLTLDQIKSAIESGDLVCWKQDNYEVIKDSIGQYLIRCKSNDNCIGLTWKDGKTMNGEEKDFYVQSFNWEGEQCSTYINQ